MKNIVANAVALGAVPFLLCLTAVFAQQPELWHGLKAGPYGAGYKAEWRYDYQRTWGDGPRPIRMDVWYPAEKITRKKMLFERYVLSEPPEKSFLPYRDLLRQRDIGDSAKSLKGCFSGSEELYNQLLNQPTNAIENAVPLKGRFPVVIYSLGGNDYSQENTVLFEYLASHGYIVIAVPQMGVLPRKPLLMGDEELSFEAQLRDLQYAYAQVHLLPGADQAKIGAMGMSMGGIYSLLSAMRNKNIKLVVGLDPTFVSSNYPSYGYKYWAAKYYDEWNIKMPVVVIHRVDSTDKNDYGILEKLKLSQREIIKIPKIIHSDFTSYPMYTASTPLSIMNKFDVYATSHRDQPTAVAGYEEVCRTVLNALEKHLNHVQGISLSDRKDAVQLNAINAPNEEEFCGIIEKEGLVKALQVFTAVSAKYPKDTIVRLTKINRIAFEYAIDRNYKMAIGAYTLCTKAYPANAPAFENLGEMYFSYGDKKQAAVNLKKALMLDPGNKDAQEMLKKL